MSYAQDSRNAASLSNREAQPVTIEDALTLTLDRLDAAEALNARLEEENKVTRERLTMEQERTRLLEATLAAREAQIRANETTIAAQNEIIEQKDLQIQTQAQRITSLERRGTNRSKAFITGVVVGFIGGKLLRF